MAGPATLRLGAALAAAALGRARGAAFTLELTWGYPTPDCVQRNPTVLTNGAFPGPVLTVTAGEHVQVTVKNRLHSTAVNFHWHGVEQRGTPWADGAAMVTNCPIQPNLEHVYEFTAPLQPGTHLYHGHVGLDREAGAVGMLLVDPPAGALWPLEQRHDHSVPLLLDDWYHAPGLTMLTGLLQQGFRWAGDPQSVLVNGRGHFNCSDNALYTCSDELCELEGTSTCSAKEKPYYLPDSHFDHCSEQHCPGHEEVSVASGQRYLLRLGNLASLSFLNVAVEGHQLTVVELDGEPVRPVNVSSLDLHSGQRAAALLEADQPIGAYWISITVRGRPAPRTGQAVLRYAGASGLPGQARLAALQASQPAWDDVAFSLAQQRLFEHPDAATAPGPEQVHHRFVFLNTQERFTAGEHQHRPLTNPGPVLAGVGPDRPENQCNATGRYLKWAIARSTYIDPSTPVLHSLYYNTAGVSQLTEDRGFYRLDLNQTYEVVLQNYPACNGVCETHPWHLHGHRFWVVGTWPGEFNGTLPAAGSGGRLHKRDTTMVIGEGDDHRPATRAGCGFTVLRFVADNPGAWAFHCHAEWHAIMGMRVVFYTAPQTIPAPDAHHTICGAATPGVVLARGRAADVAAVAADQSRHQAVVSSARRRPRHAQDSILATGLAVLAALVALAR